MIVKELIDKLKQVHPYNEVYVDTWEDKINLTDSMEIFTTDWTTTILLFNIEDAKE